MRIAFSNSSHIWGGAEVVTEVLARGLQARGHEVLILCRPGSPFLERVAADVACEATLGGFDMNPVSVARSAFALRRHRSRAVMTMTVKDPRIAGPAGRLAGVPVVVRHPMDVPFRRGLRFRLFYGWIPALLVANSQATRRTMLQSAPWLDPSDVAVIYNGVDVSRFERARPAELGLPHGAVAVGFVGRMERRKGFAELMAAWPAVAAANPDVHLVLVGRGGDLETEARQRFAGESRVHFLGFRRDAAEVIRALDVLALPSRQEGFGLVVAEAMAAGVPVVASLASNLPELVDDGVEGRLVPIRDPDALAAAILQLAGDGELRRRMGRAGFERVQRDFTLDRMIAEYEALFAGVVEGVRHV